MGDRGRGADYGAGTEMIPNQAARLSSAKKKKNENETEDRALRSELSVRAAPAMLLTLRKMHPCTDGA